MKNFRLLYNIIYISMFSKINIIFRTIYLNLTWKNNDRSIFKNYYLKNQYRTNKWNLKK